jgi:hypothetical protein
MLNSFLDTFYHRILPSITTRPPTIPKKSIEKCIPLLEKSINHLHTHHYDAWEIKPVYNAINSTSQFLIALHQLKPQEIQQNREFIRDSARIMKLRTRTIEETLKNK